MRVLTTRYKDLTCVAYSWDGAALYTLSQAAKLSSGGVQRWDGSDGSPVTVDCGPLAVRRMTVLPADELLVGGGALNAAGLIRWIGPLLAPYTPDTERVLPGVTGHAQLAVSPAGDRIAHPWFRLNTPTLSEGGVVSYRLPLGSHLPAMPEWEERVGCPCACVFDPTGARLTVIEYEAGKRNPQYSLRWHDAATGKPVSEPIPIPPVGETSFVTGGGTRLVTMRGAFLLSIDLTDPTAKPVQVKSADGKHFTGLAVHPDGRRVLATGNDHTVREYDATTLQELRAYAWKVGRLRCVAIAPDGLTAAAGSDSGKVVVWDLE